MNRWAFALFDAFCDVVKAATVLTAAFWRVPRCAFQKLHAIFRKFEVSKDFLPYQSCGYELDVLFNCKGRIVTATVAAVRYKHRLFFLDICFFRLSFRN